MENTLGNSNNDFALDNYSLRIKTPLREWDIEFKGEMTLVKHTIPLIQ